MCFKKLLTMKILFVNHKTFGKWYVTGEVIGRVDKKQIQKLEEVIFAFFFLRFIIKPKNRYVFYD